MASRTRAAAGRLIRPPETPRVRERRRQSQAEDRERLVDVLPGTDRDRGDGDPVLEHEAPTAHPGDALTHGRVGVGIAGSGDRHRPGHLGVGQGRQERCESGDRERDPDGGPGERDGGAEDDEDAGAERGADADHRELPDAERTAERFTVDADGRLGLQLLDRLAAGELLAEGRGTGRRGRHGTSVVRGRGRHMLARPLNGVKYTRRTARRNGGRRACADVRPRGYGCSMSMGGGMRGGGGGPRGGGRISSGDFRAQKAANAEAPKIPHLVKRIAGLFLPHRRAIILTVVLVLIGAAISVIPPLLTQQALDRGLFPPSGSPDVPVLVELVSAMVLLWIASAGVGVWQTYLTATVGNKVMGAMRMRLFGHLQRMELAFFTRTKTGVIQSRLQNDVGGVASVLNNTISSVLGNTVTVIAAIVAMLLLSWQMTLVAVVLLRSWSSRSVGWVRSVPASPGRRRSRCPT